jgi:hypothetical protein
LRARPFGPLVEALGQLGAHVEDGPQPGFLPVAATGPLQGGPVRLPGHLSSQFLSGALMAGPLMRDGLEVELTSPLVSVPYLTMTTAVMAAFGVTVDGLRVDPGRYQPINYVIEPDASAASYFLAAATVTGGQITVDGLGTSRSRATSRSPACWNAWAHGWSAPPADWNYVEPASALSSTRTGSPSTPALLHQPGSPLTTTTGWPRACRCSACVPRHRDRQPRLCRQDLPRLLHRPREAPMNIRQMSV